MTIKALADEYNTSKNEYLANLEDAHYKEIIEYKKRLKKQEDELLDIKKRMETKEAFLNSRIDEFRESAELYRASEQKLRRKISVSNYSLKKTRTTKKK